MIIIQLKDPISTRVLIAKNGLTIRGLSNKIGVSHSYLSQIFNGTKKPSATVAGKISKGLNKKIEEIFLFKVVDEQPMESTH